jgi:hypothetical protein
MSVWAVISVTQGEIINEFLKKSRLSIKSIAIEFSDYGGSLKK